MTQAVNGLAQKFNELDIDANKNVVVANMSNGDAWQINGDIDPPLLMPMARMIPMLQQDLLESLDGGNPNVIKPHKPDMSDIKQNMGDDNNIFHAHCI